MKNTTSRFSIVTNGEPATIGNIELRDIQPGKVYVMQSPYMGDYMQAQALLTRDADALIVTIIGLDDADAVAEQSGTKAVSFQLDLLRSLQSDGARLIAEGNESEFFIEFLTKNPEIERYNLETLVETVAFHVIEANNCGCLRAFDAKFGTRYQRLVKCSPYGDFPIDEAYSVMCSSAAETMLNEKVTITWALRKFELEQRGRIKYTVAEIIFLAYKTYKQLERDIMQLVRNDSPSKRSLLREIDVVEAMELFKEGVSVYVDWVGFVEVKQGSWCELNINHLQNGKWFTSASL